ncbi:PREDICTED: uncharacterized protein LOC109189578 isoform X2 [Ipomoea nil]|uniref:uncharacterized protein LOC109189578 isoform X2 n=1 Tax=Ipomoea nil TaxID=35883 RepID=UPI000900A809|nr:PREDICTED: uncharacterized protein LOC109189578 isoform X2 [Ipomoea nil]
MDCWFTPYSDIKIVGMIFFPILCRGHYFLLCFDILHYRYEITDNDSDPTSKTLKYGDSLEDMASRSPSGIVDLLTGTLVCCTN